MISFIVCDFFLETGSEKGVYLQTKMYLDFYWREKEWELAKLYSYRNSNYQPVMK